MDRNKYIIIPVKDSKLFIPNKTSTEDFYNKNGILVSVGRLISDPDGSPVTQEYLFDKAKWVIEDANKWVKDNGGFLDCMLDKPDKGDKTMDKILGPITKSMSFEIKEFDKKAMTLTGIASTSKVDRAGDTLDVNGWNLKDYKKNPVMLWGHNAGMPPIARVEKIGVEDDKLVFKAKFVPREIYPFAGMIYDMYTEKFLNAFSVRFDPKEWRERKEKEKPNTDPTIVRRKFYWSRDYLKQDLLEISPVTIPALPGALVNRGYQDMIAKSFLAETYESLSEEDKLKLYVGEKRKGCGKCDSHECNCATYGCEDELNGKEEPAKTTPPVKETPPVPPAGDQDPVISKEDIAKIAPLLDILKSGRVISEKNKKLIKSAVDSLDKTVTALNALLSIPEPAAERSVDEIVADLAGELKEETDEEKKVIKEKMKQLLEISTENERVLNTLVK